MDTGDSLALKPWIFLTSAGDSMTLNKLYVKSFFTTESYHVYVTDTSKVWCEELASDAVVKRNKTINPSLEAPLDKLLDHLKKELQHGDQSKITCKVPSNAGDTMYLILETSLAGLPFAWKFKCYTCDDKVFAEQFSYPVLSMIEELQRQQRELMKIIKAKDTEIDDLKSQGVRTSRKHLETKPFEEAAFVKNAAASKDFERLVKQDGQDAFGDKGQELYHNIMAKKARLNGKIDNEFSDDVMLTASPSKSPTKSPNKSPQKTQTVNTSPVKATLEAASPSKDTELMRREALQKRLAEEQERKEIKKKKKKFKL